MYKNEEGVQFLVCGAGMAGLCGAIAAARQGLRTVLVEKEWMLGGNGGPLLGVNWGGSLRHHQAWHETGIVEELTERVMNEGGVTLPTGLAINVDPMVDVVLAQVLDEAGVTVLRRHMVEDVAVSDGRIANVAVRNLENLERFDLSVDGFVLDSSGDAAVAAMAGADTMIGRESNTQTGERSAPDEPDEVVSASSITAMTVDVGIESPFTPPEGTLKWNPDKPANTFQPGRRLNMLFQVDTGGESPGHHPLHSPQEVWLSLRRHMFSMWDYMKNELYPEEAKTHKLVWISPLLGRRETRRVVGDYVLTQTDAESGRTFEDAVAISGHSLDYHPPSEDGGYETIFYSAPVPFDVPLRCIYSRNIGNLFMAGRNISTTHVAFSSTRIIRTGGQLGQAAATAAAVCLERGVRPREIAENCAGELRERLARDDVWLPGVAAKRHGMRKGEGENGRAFEHSNNRVTSGEESGVAVAASSEARVSWQGDGRPGGEWGVAGDGVGAVVYTYPERLERGEVYVRNPTDSAVTVELFAGYGAAPVPHWPDVHERAAGERYEFCSPDPEYYPVAFEMVAQKSVEVAAGYTGWIDADLVIEKLPEWDRNRYSQAMIVGVSGDVEVLCAEHGLDTVDGAVNQGERWKTEPGASPLVRITPDPVPGAAAHLLDGVIHRQGLAHLHAWVSAPGEEMPQWVMCEMDEPVTVNAVTLRFDTTARFMREHYTTLGLAASPRCVADYRVEMFDGCDWIEVARECDNYLRWRRHELVTPMVAQKVRLVVERMNGDGEMARVYGVEFGTVNRE